MRPSELDPIPVYELLLVYRIFDDLLVSKFCYQSSSDFQAVRDAIDHVNTMVETTRMTVISLEVFCAELGFRGIDLNEPNLIVNRIDHQIYDSGDLDTSLIEELPLHMEGRVA